MMALRWTLAAAVLFACGCGSSPAPNKLPSGKYIKFDEQLAKDSFGKFLETWKRGETVAGLQEKSISILVSDLDCLSGAKLVSYRIIEPQRVEGDALHVAAELRLRSREGKERTETIDYVVVTSPHVTIMRGT
jgi:hypothetical protein